jgi:hypothetical protein
MKNSTRNKDLAAIHGTARRLGLGEFQRRALQYDVTGRESCLEMNAAERRAVIEELNRVKVQPAPTPKYTDDDCSDEACVELLGY